MKKINWKIVLHVCFWIIVETIFNRSCHVNESIWEWTLKPGELEWIFLMYLIHGLSFYSFYFIFKIDYKFTLRVLGAYIVNFFLVFGIRFFLLNHFYEVLDHPTYFAHLRWQENSLWRTAFFATYATLMVLVESRLRFAKMEKELNQQNKQSEIALLRSQINPHFLYNTLNNIYSLAYPKSTEAAQAVMKLSDIMRYSLTEANQKFVPLQKEIDYLQSYISLEKIRYRDTSSIDFSISGDIDNIQIAPMLFVSFVENAFKHGDINKDKKIAINLSVLKNELTFKVANFYNKNNQKAEGGGIGLRNVKRRLELIYPKSHLLNITDDDENSKFMANLKIKF